MQVSDVMTDYVVAVSTEATLATARRAMDEHGIRHLPVVDDGQVIGMLGQRELASTASIAARFNAERDAYEAYLQTPVRDFLKTRFSAKADVVTVSPEAPIAAAVDALVDHRLSALPVLDGGGQLVGIISYIDVLIALRRLL